MATDKKIAEAILRAQTASDGGKGKKYLVCSKRSRRDYYAGYNAKDRHIMTAINLINSGHSNYKFAVFRDTQRVAKYIIYFQTVINGEKVQISFHSFDSSLERFLDKSFRIKWDRRNSRDSAVKAYRYYVSNGEYTWY